MSKKIQCISPINGTVFAERDVSTMDASFAAVTRAKTAGKAWAARPYLSGSHWSWQGSQDLAK